MHGVVRPGGVFGHKSELGATPPLRFVPYKPSNTFRGNLNIWEYTLPVGFVMCTVFPRTTEALTRFVRKRAPTLAFGAVALFTNLEADFHQDVNNCPSSMNWVHPLSSFTEGGIWVESPGGDTVMWARGPGADSRTEPGRHPAEG